MPDTNQAAPAPSPTTETRAKTTTRSSAPPSPAPGSEATRTAHFVLQGKGGVGKSLVASLLAQYLSDQGRLAACYDTDPVNGSFQSIPALGAEPIELLTKNAINAKGVDRLIETIVAAEKDVVVDSGAASFLPLSRYLIENDVPGVLAQHGVRMMVHTIVTGGGNGMDTVKGLNALILHFAPGAQICVWVNEYYGPARFKGTDFEHTTVYSDNHAKLRGTIYLRQLDPDLSAPNFAEMLERKMTFAEAAASGDFMLMEKSRLFRIKNAIWEQLGLVI